MKKTAFSPHDGIFVDYVKSKKKHNMPVQHYHASYEIYVQLDGIRKLLCNDICYTLRRGDMAIIKPFEIHYAESGETDFYERFVMNFQDEDLSCILNEAETAHLTEQITSCVMRLKEEQIKKMCGLFADVKKYSLKRGVLAKKALAAQLFSTILYLLELIQAEMPESGKKIASHVSSAIKYINKHYRDDLTLDKICAEVSTSKYHFCHTFKETTGATVMEYINNVRLTKAHSLLLNTDGSLGDIAAQTGFKTAVNLNRAFKKAYNMPPREFRRRRRADKAL